MSWNEYLLMFSTVQTCRCPKAVVTPAPVYVACAKPSISAGEG
jgi:hypothetical protein